MCSKDDLHQNHVGKPAMVLSRGLVKLFFQTKVLGPVLEFLTGPGWGEDKHKLQQALSNATLITRRYLGRMHTLGPHAKNPTLSPPPQQTYSWSTRVTT